MRTVSISRTLEEGLFLTGWPLSRTRATRDRLYAAIRRSYPKATLRYRITVSPPIAAGYEGEWEAAAAISVVTMLDGSEAP